MRVVTVSSNDLRPHIARSTVQGFKGSADIEDILQTRKFPIASHETQWLPEFLCKKDQNDPGQVSEVEP